jgi:hypothetical protein
VPVSLRETVLRLDPIHNIERLAAGCRPLLMINGGDDLLVSCDGNKRLLKELRARYGQHPRRVQLTVLGGVGHATPPHMLDEATGFLRQHLCGVGVQGDDKDGAGAVDESEKSGSRKRQREDVDERSHTSTTQGAPNSLELQPPN